jgi:hypothetical protein
VLRRLIGKGKDREVQPGKLTYEDARASLETHAHNARLFLAKRPDVEPEILYYLANDESADVRRLVAANPGTPQQANRLLAQDGDVEVRCELARKVGRQANDPDAKWTARSRALAYEVMELLAHDKVARVRAILAEEIKTATTVPAHIIEDLACDQELIVRAPVLMYSPLIEHA